jgi:hypothetical protein
VNLHVGAESSAFDDGMERSGAFDEEIVERAPEFRSRRG